MSRTACAIDAIRRSSRVSRSSSPSDSPLSRPRSRSSALAVTISSVAPTRASAIASSASSLAVRGSRASCREARWAPSARALTCSTAAGSIVSAAMLQGYGAPEQCRRPVLRGGQGGELARRTLPGEELGALPTEPALLCVDLGILGQRGQGVGQGLHILARAGEDGIATDLTHTGNV